MSQPHLLKPQSDPPLTIFSTVPLQKQQHPPLCDRKVVYLCETCQVLAKINQTGFVSFGAKLSDLFNSIIPLIIMILRYFIIKYFCYILSFMKTNTYISLLMRT
jgi:hypothetical protein